MDTSRETIIIPNPIPEEKENYFKTVLLKEVDVITVFLLLLFKK